MIGIVQQSVCVCICKNISWICWWQSFYIAFHFSLYQWLWVKLSRIGRLENVSRRVLPFVVQCGSLLFDGLRKLCQFSLAECPCWFEKILTRRAILSSMDDSSQVAAAYFRSYGRMGLHRKSTGRRDVGYAKRMRKYCIRFTNTMDVMGLVVRQISQQYWSFLYEL